MMTQPKSLTIGTRGSELALVQAHMVRDQLIAAWPNIIDVHIKIITTSGDWKPNDGETRLSTQKGGKAQFAKEIEEQLLAGTIDIAVHSMKDMDSTLPDGLTVNCILPREDTRDALLLRDRKGILATTPIADWPAGITIGTASVRRQAILLAQNPDLKIIPLRGNVETRINKLRGDLAAQHPDLDATLLAVAGLNRLGLSDEIDHIFPLNQMIPAAAQGAIGIEICINNPHIETYLAPLNCEISHRRIIAEREVLKFINGSCHTPIGLHAEYNTQDSIMHLSATLYALDGGNSCAVKQSAAIKSRKDAVNLGRSVGQEILKQASRTLLEQSA